MNRRKFMEIAEQQLALAQRYCYPTSLLLVDIDHFKLVNDLYGHVMGDRALIQLTRVMAAELRETDTMARFGGEEFIMLLPHTARQGALSVAERVRTAARQHIIKQEDSETSVTISIGGVTCETSATPLDTMISRADKLLYESKQAGRDRCSIEAIPGLPPLPILQKQLHKQVS
jgi:diguanylate cyclase (GGDEF)-like protein